MRAALLLVLLASRVAAADDPVDLPLADDPIEILHNELTVRPLARSTVDDAHARIVFDAGGARLVMTIAPTPFAAGSDLQKQIRYALRHEPARVANADVEPFATNTGLDGLALVPVTPAHAGELVLVAYIVAVDDTVERLAFYVDDVATADPSWVAVARRIALTAAPPPLVTHNLGAWTLDLPPEGWTHVYPHESFQFFGAAHTDCWIGPDTAAPTVPADALTTPGTLLGHEVTWSTYHPDAWRSTARLGPLVVSCHGPEQRDALFGRYLANTLAVRVNDAHR